MVLSAEDVETFRPTEWAQLRAKLESATRQELIRLHRMLLREEAERDAPLHDNRTHIGTRISLAEKLALKELASTKLTTSAALIRLAVQRYIRDNTH